MKNIFIVSAGILAVSIALPAMAGPNWSIIHEARKMSQQQHDSTQKGSTEQEEFPIDHGPRAKSTPWLNKEREQEILAHAHDKKTSVFAAHSQYQSSHT